MPSSEVRCSRPLGHLQLPALGHADHPLEQSHHPLLREGPHREAEGVSIAWETMVFIYLSFFQFYFLEIRIKVESGFEVF